jgi:hypothetical protein
VPSVVRSALHIAARNGDADALAPLVSAAVAAATTTSGAGPRAHRSQAALSFTGHTALAAAVTCKQNHVLPLLIGAAAQAGGLPPQQVLDGGAMAGASSLLVAQVRLGQ